MGDAISLAHPWSVLKLISVSNHFPPEEYNRLAVGLGARRTQWIGRDLPFSFFKLEPWLLYSPTHINTHRHTHTHFLSLSPSLPFTLCISTHGTSAPIENQVNREMAGIPAD